jgi:hypothetical protein
MSDQQRLLRIRRWLERGQLSDALREAYAWFADYQLALRLLPTRERALRPFLWHSLADLAELAGDLRLTEQCWQALDALMPEPPVQPSEPKLPLLGIPVVNGPQRLEALLASLDVPVQTLALVDHSGGPGLVRDLMNRLESDGWPGVDCICVERPFGNSGVARAWNSVLLNFPSAAFALIANHDVVFAPGVLAQVIRSVDPSKPQWLPLLSRPAAFSAFVITPLVWNRIGLFDESFRPAYWEDTDYRDRLEADPSIQRLEQGPWLAAMDAANPSQSASLQDDPTLRLRNEASFALNRLWYHSRRRLQGDQRGAWLRAWLLDQP